jgi:processive 1,2-diacylglycerol beta-glucosyltransferase
MEPARILVLSASVGEGHESAARALATDLKGEQPAAEVIVRDVLPVFGPLLRWVLRDLYRLQLRFAPWVYGCLFWLFTRVTPFRLLGYSALVLLGSRPLRRLITAHEPDLVVSTYPSVTAILGHARRRGRVAVPVCATITDLAGLVYWAHRGIDLHLVMHKRCLEEVERVAGPGSARRVRPLVAPAFFSPIQTAEARKRLRIPGDAPLVVVSGGGWGVGDLSGAVAAALAIEGVFVVAVCGRNDLLRDRLEERFGASVGVHVLGFTDTMPELLAAADVLVHTTGGVTCLEALACGCSIVTYGEPPGHARMNDRFLCAHGLARSARDTEELRAVLAQTLDGGGRERPWLPPAPSAAALVAAVQARVVPLPAWRRRLVPVVLATAALLPLAGWTFASGEAYETLARPLDLRPLTAVKTGRPEIGLIVDCPASLVQVLSAELRARASEASFAFAAAPSMRTRRRLFSLGDEPIPLLERRSTTQWLSERTRLGREAHNLGLRRRFRYLTPAGLTLGQYLLIRSVGGLPVAGSIRISGNAISERRSPSPGSVIVLSTGDSVAASLQSLDRVLAQSTTRGLSAVSLSTLLTDSRRPASGGERSSVTAPTMTRASEPASIAAAQPEGQFSRTRIGARATGTSVSTAKMAGAT